MIDAAVRLLRRGGVEAVTHQAVAAEAGVGRATVYRHWPSLTNLLIDALADTAPVVDFGEGDLRSQLLHEFRQRLPEINSPVAVAVVGVLVGRSDHDDQVDGLRDQIFGRVVDAISHVIGAAVDDGQLVSEAPARDLAAMILGALLLERTLLAREITAEHVTRVVDASLRGWWK